MYKELKQKEKNKYCNIKKIKLFMNNKELCSNNIKKSKNNSSNNNNFNNIINKNYYKIIFKNKMMNY